MTKSNCQINKTKEGYIFLCNYDNCRKDCAFSDVTDEKCIYNPLNSSCGNCCSYLKTGDFVDKCTNTEAQEEELQNIANWIQGLVKKNKPKIIKRCLYCGKPLKDQLDFFCNHGCEMRFITEMEEKYK